MKNFVSFLLNIILTALLVVSVALASNAVFQSNYVDALRYFAVLIVLVFASGLTKRKPAFLAVISTLTRFSAVNENNSYAGQGILSYVAAYAATSALVLKAAYLQHVCYAQLTGAMTINATLTNLKQFDEVVFWFDTDGTQRIVTFGTGFLSSGTVTIPASKGAVVKAIFDGVALRVLSREIYA
jgi:hypothetical protein